MASSEQREQNLGVKQVADDMHEGLRRYIEAQYHVKDTGLIEERRVLLQEQGTISQEPYVESTPTYHPGLRYAELGLPHPVGETLAALSTWEPGIGVFEKPYAHQAEALQSFLVSGKDIVVATGTGSGKTESFLFPLLGQLLVEAAERPRSFQMPGFRALLLYPMNALVSDQVSRLRRLFGDERLSSLFLSRYGRFPRFGMYTGRTPYPGARDSARDQRHMRAVLKYYVDLERDQSGTPKDKQERLRLVRELKSRGRWPAKDLQKFYGEEGSKWENRLKTQPGDRELMMRQEMQAQCPDLLVTNYSMLEYMLLRPIERTIFKQTRDWLASDVRNKVVLVLDEAHMYRGAGGAEVGLLIRRLQARLGIDRSRMRCILTSASLGRGPEAERAVKEFAVGLTGRPSNDPAPFVLIRGTREKREPGAAGTDREATALADFDLTAFMKRVENPKGAVDAVTVLATRLDWPAPPHDSTAVTEVEQWQGSGEDKESASKGGNKLSKYLFDVMRGFGPLEMLIEMTSGNAVALTRLSRTLFPTVEEQRAQAATASLLALGTYAHNGTRTLLPTRVHLFFRGLPALYACVNPRCERRRYSPGDPQLLGRLYTEPRLRCDCSAQARVYELYTHRDCGAAFLRVFNRGEDRTFYWHEKGGEVEKDNEFNEDMLLAEDEPHRDMGPKVEPIWLEMTTGKVLTAPPTSEPERYHRLWRASRDGANSKSGRSGKRGKGKQAEQENVDGGDEGSGGNGEQRAFTQCPACTKSSVAKIMALGTIGEAPFAELVRTQFEQQPLEKSIDAHFPNGGRKVLLFSDGRQKAARLARDLPRAVEFDSFRQALALSVQRLNALDKEATLEKRLYLAFVSVCSDNYLHFFDQEDKSQEKLSEDKRRFQKYYDSLEDALDEDWSATPPPRYDYALLRQLSDPYYSLYAACAAVVKPTKKAIKILQRELASIPNEFAQNSLPGVATIWIQALLERGAFDMQISDTMRWLVMEFYRPVKPGEVNRKFERLLKEGGKLGDADIKAITSQLYGLLTETGNDGFVYLKPDMLKLELAVDDEWAQCSACGLTQHVVMFGCCSNCGSRELVMQPPNSPYMSSRKGYFREPLRQVLAGGRPMHLVAEEHTAQLSQRDAGVVYATTEEYELRFQDVLLQDQAKPGEYKTPVDVLSCTTTMEVGIDIGSLTAIGLRNVPPQRENYQQRAGRSGRRGVAISTVQTFAQGGPHENYYYAHPYEIISGEPRVPRVNIGNRRLARRHVHSFLIQTFFQQQLDSLTNDEQEEIKRTRTNLMSALGPAADFFANEGRFTFANFKRWLASNRVELMQRIAEWLPDEVCASSDRSSQALANEKIALGEEIAHKFEGDLSELGKTYVGGASHPQDAERARGSDGQSEPEVDQSTLINVLFDAGLLPSYAFPTNLCSFFVFEDEKGQVRIKERAQQGKQQALSEYAPGRLLVINKETYRVGGIYTEGARTAEPAAALFAKQLDTYVYCSACEYVRLNEKMKQGEECPVCKTELQEVELLDPPGFSPERGRPLRERDRDQDITYASAAQLPTPIEADKFNWMEGIGAHLRHAFAENRRLIVVNQGASRQGFKVCESCGAAWSDSQEVPAGKHLRPFLIEQYILNNEGLTRQCGGPIHQQRLYLGHGYLTDLLVMRLDFAASFDYDPQHPWLRNALRTAAESIALAASRQLDIDAGELSAGFRWMPPTASDEFDAKGAADIFLYDTASGGAGFAAETGEILAQVIEGALGLLEGCPAHCDRSCTKCLRHYGNRYWHETLDRHLGAQLLRYVYFGQPPALPVVEEQRKQLVGLARFLELEGWEMDAGRQLGNIEAPIMVREPSTGRRVAVGTYPALLDEKEVEHPLQRAALSTTRIALIRDYIAVRDLPAAYEQLLKEAKIVK